MDRGEPQQSALDHYLKVSAQADDNERARRRLLVLLVLFVCSVVAGAVLFGALLG
jgi:hypothetical protein